MTEPSDEMRGDFTQNPFRYCSFTGCYNLRDLRTANLAVQGPCPSCLDELRSATNRPSGPRKDRPRKDYDD